MPSKATERSLMDIAEGLAMSATSSEEFLKKITPIDSPEQLPGPIDAMNVSEEDKVEVQAEPIAVQTELPGWLLPLKNVPNEEVFELRDFGVIYQIQNISHPDNSFSDRYLVQCKHGDSWTTLPGLFSGRYNMIVMEKLISELAGSTDIIVGQPKIATEPWKCLWMTKTNIGINGYSIPNELLNAPVTNWNSHNMAIAITNTYDGSKGLRCDFGIMSEANGVEVFNPFIFSSMNMTFGHNTKQINIPNTEELISKINSAFQAVDAVNERMIESVKGSIAKVLPKTLREEFNKLWESTQIKNMRNMSLAASVILNKNFGISEYFTIRSIFDKVYE